MSIDASRWTLLGGILCLDFTNTKNWNAEEKPYDFFWDYPAFLRWGLQLGLLTQTEAETRLQLADGRKIEAQASLKKAVHLRETIYQAFSRITDRQPVSPETLEIINTAWIEAMRHLKVTPEREKFTLEWMAENRELDSVLWPVTKSAVELLVSDKINRVKRCSGCGWLFLDATRDGRRRWCNMKICGNRAKARRHYERSQPRGVPTTARGMGKNS